MPHQFIKELQDQENVRCVFRAANKMMRPNRNGDSYLQVELADRTGSITARMWNAGTAAYNAFENGDYISVEGKAQLFQGTMQVILKKIHRASPDDVDPDVFVMVSNAEIERLTAKMAQKLRELGNPFLRALAEAYLLDEAFLAAFTRLPAGIKQHHAHSGGLLEHVVKVMELAGYVGNAYPELDTELLVFCAFLHDTGKTLELEGETEFSYSSAGQMLGHMQLGISMFEQKIVEAEKLLGEPIPQDLVLRLKHMILSHHGEYEYGSAKLPMTLEAMAIHSIDTLDARLDAFSQTIREDLNTDSPWTAYHPALQRKIFKEPFPKK